MDKVTTKVARKLSDAGTRMVSDQSCKHKKLEKNEIHFHAANMIYWRPDGVISKTPDDDVCLVERVG